MKDIEQKYKFWNTEKREMYGPYTLEGMLLGVTQTDVLSCLSIYRDDCKVLQYTNKKDMNGTEIYHKDVLRIVEEDEAPREGVVKWTDIGWSVDSSWLSDLNEHAEVIGSVYKLREKVKQH